VETRARGDPDGVVEGEGGGVIGREDMTRRSRKLEGELRRVTFSSHRNIHTYCISRGSWRMQRHSGWCDYLVLEHNNHAIDFLTLPPAVDFNLDLLCMVFCVRESHI
jgi:hypothetical protein